MRRGILGLVVLLALVAGLTGTAQAAKYDNDTVIVKFAGDDDLYRTQVWCAEVTRRGAFVHPHHNWFISTAHTEEDVKLTLEAADAGFAIVKEQFGT